jgi:hypothetical protein
MLPMVGDRSDQDSESNLLVKVMFKMAPIFTKAYNFEVLYNQLYVGHGWR